MDLQGKQLKPNTSLNSGRVRRFEIPSEKIRITQITTFCPDIVGPGPTHLYLIETRDLVLLLDTGLPTHLAKQLLFRWRNNPIPSEIQALPSDFSEQQLYEGIRLTGHILQDINILVISHGHFDHFLLGSFLLNRAKARVVAHILDTPEICNPWGLMANIISRNRTMRATGMPGVPDAPLPNAPANRLGSLDYSFKVDSPVMASGALEVDGVKVKGICVKHMPGHSPGSIGLLVGEGENKILLCGDVLLYPITPHPDNLLLYLRTLEELKKVDRVNLILPAHGRAIRDLPGRLSFLLKHHRRRLKLTYEACFQPRSVWEIATLDGYFKLPLDPDAFNPLAAMEALVHVEMLQMAHGIARSHVRGVTQYFRNSGEPFEDVYQRIMETVRNSDISMMMRY